MKASLFGLVVCASALAIGCGKKQAPTSNAGVGPVTGAGSPAAATPEVVGGGAAKSDEPGLAPATPPVTEPKVEPAPKPLTTAEFEALLLALSACKLDGYMIDPKCKEAIAFRDALAAKGATKDLGDLPVKLAIKLLTHESPVVRVKATEILGTHYGAGEKGHSALAEAYSKEKDKNVRLALLRTMGAYASFDPKAASLLAAALEDADLEVRAHAVYSLTMPVNKRLTGAIDLLIEVIEKDPDPKLRQAACEHAGKLGDEKLLPIIAKMTEAKADPGMQDACMRGLVAMWVDVPRFENASERAYHLTLRLLERTPRTKSMPSYAAIARLGKLAQLDDASRKPSESEAQAYASWKRRSSDWYKPEQVLRSLRSIVTDQDADDLAAAQAVEALSALGAVRLELEMLKKSLDGSPRLAAGGPVSKAFEEVLGLPKKVGPSTP